MTGLAAVLCVATALALAIPVPSVLVRAAWPSRHPVAAVIVWQLVAVIGGGATIAAPILAGDAIGGRFPLVAGLVTGAAVAGYLGIHLGLTVLRRERRRRRHVTLLMLLGREVLEPDVIVIDRPEPVAYCVPRPRRPLIVVTSGLTARLEADELRAVIEHERAHARQHHDVLLLAFEAWRSALPGFPAARLAAGHVGRLVEMVADDRASRAVGGSPLIRAMDRMSATGEADRRARFSPVAA